GAPADLDFEQLASEQTQQVVTDRLRAGTIDHVVVATPPAPPGAGTEWTVRAVGSLVRLIQLTADTAWSYKLGHHPRIWLITRGAMPVGGRAVEPAHAALWGVVKTLAHELPDLFGGMLDLDPATPAGPGDAGLVAAAIGAAGTETWLAS